MEMHPITQQDHPGIKTGYATVQALASRHAEQRHKLWQWQPNTVQTQQSEMPPVTAGNHDGSLQDDEFCTSFLT